MASALGTNQNLVATWSRLCSSILDHFKLLPGTELAASVEPPQMFQSLLELDATNEPNHRLAMEIFFDEIFLRLNDKESNELFLSLFPNQLVLVPRIVKWITHTFATLHYAPSPHRQVCEQIDGIEYLIKIEDTIGWLFGVKAKPKTIIIKNFNPVLKPLLRELLRLDSSRSFTLSSLPNSNQALLFCDPTKPCILLSIPQIYNASVPSDDELNLAQRWSKRQSTCLLAFGLIGTDHKSTVNVEKLDSLEFPPLSLDLKNPKQLVPLEPFDTPSNAGPKFTEALEYLNGIIHTLNRFFTIKHQSLSPGWILSQVPENSSTSLAGFLFAAGSIGLLGDLDAYSIYKLLSKKHDLTKASLILGLSIAKRGTMDERMHKIIGVHLPRYSADLIDEELKIAYEVQLYSVLALGFLAEGSANRTISNYLFKRIISTSELYSPAFRLSLGFALGLANCGMGWKGIGLDPDKLEFLATINDLRLPSCMLALSLAFFDTNEEKILQKIAKKDANERPTHAILRTICCSLIIGNNGMYDLEGLINEFANPLRLAKFLDKTNITSTSLGITRASLLLVSPEELHLQHQLCYRISSMALFHAIKRPGCCNEQLLGQLLKAYATLIDYYKPVAAYTTDYGDMTLDAPFKFLMDSLLLAASLLYAGSGDGRIFRLLRRWIQDPLDFRYERGLFHNLALGFLFMRQGKYRFPLYSSDAAEPVNLSTDSFTTSMLLCTIFPIAGGALEDFGNSAMVPLVFRLFWAVCPLDKIEVDDLKEEQYYEDIFMSSATIATAREYYQRKGHVDCVEQFHMSKELMSQFYYNVHGVLASKLNNHGMAIPAQLLFCNDE